MTYQICRNPTCQNSHDTAESNCPDCGHPYKTSIQPMPNFSQELLLEHIKDVVRAQMKAATKSGLTKEQVLEAIKEILE
jgi:hypothetical protein